MIFRAVVSVIIVVALSLFIVPVASAHSTQPRVEISMERANPGMVISVRGVSFDRDDIVNLALIGSSTEFSFGEVTADPEGELIYNASLPRELLEGTYYFRATTVHHWVLSPPVTVWGIAYEEGGGQGPRDEDDGLLAPMPTFPPAVVTTPVPQAPAEAMPGSTGNRNLIPLAVLIVVGIVLAFSMMRKRVR